jgi:hypothetical protein
MIVYAIVKVSPERWIVVKQPDPNTPYEFHVVTRRIADRSDAMHIRSQLNDVDESRWSDKTRAALLH